MTARWTSLRAVGCVLLVASILPTASAHDGNAEPGFAKVTRADHPLLAGLPEPPTSTRLWAQLSSQGDAYFTLDKEILPSPFTPAPLDRNDPLVTFSAFPHITTSHADGELQYGARDVHAAWDAGFVDGQPVVVEWRLSSGMRGSDMHGPVPALVVTTRLKAISDDDFGRTLSERTVRAQFSEVDEPNVVRVELPPPSDVIRTGDRLVVELDWKWQSAPVYGPLRQPLVSVHPGSFMDIPIEEPVRLVDMRERDVSGQLYVQARIAHLFAVENIDLRGANLLLNGPGVNVQGGRPLVKAPLDGEDDGHVATFDWQVPLRHHNLRAGEYAFFLMAGQYGEQGPRVLAKRTMDVHGAENAIDAPSLVPVVALGMIAAALVATLALRRRP